MSVSFHATGLQCEMVDIAGVEDLPSLGFAAVSQVPSHNRRQQDSRAEALGGMKVCWDVKHSKYLGGFFFRLSAFSLLRRVNHLYLGWSNCPHAGQCCSAHRAVLALSKMPPAAPSGVTQLL